MKVGNEVENWSIASIVLAGAKRDDSWDVMASVGTRVFEHVHPSRGSQSGPSHHADHPHQSWVQINI
jgi:hypothetical protein